MRREDRENIPPRTDAEMEFAMCAVPTPLLEHWAGGAWPEPHCGVCRGVEAYERIYEGFYVGPELDNVQLIIDYHEEPLRVLPKEKKWKGNRPTYERCLRVYEQARRVLESRVASSAA